MTTTGRERGGAAVELVLVSPLLVLLALLMVAFGRLATARADVDGAARAAARAASISRDPAGAAAAARTAAEATLDGQGVTCRTLTVEPDLHAFRPGGTVTVRVTCTVDLSDLTGLKLPASRQISARFVEPVDMFRGIG